MLAIMTSITSINAKDYEDMGYIEFPEMISEVEQAEFLSSEADFELEYKTVATSLYYGGCYEYKHVWTWSGWFPERVWKRVRVTCPQAARGRGPGTTIPPH